MPRALTRPFPATTQPPRIGRPSRSPIPAGRAEIAVLPPRSLDHEFARLRIVHVAAAPRQLRQNNVVPTIRSMYSSCDFGSRFSVALKSSIALGTLTLNVMSSSALK